MSVIYNTRSIRCTKEISLADWIRYSNCTKQIQGVLEANTYSLYFPEQTSSYSFELIFASSFVYLATCRVNLDEVLFFFAADISVSLISSAPLLCEVSSAPEEDSRVDSCCWTSLCTFFQGGPDSCHFCHRGGFLLLRGNYHSQGSLPLYTSQCSIPLYNFQGALYIWAHPIFFVVDEVNCSFPPVRKNYFLYFKANNKYLWDLQKIKETSSKH